ncbi:hypothetical protein ACA910_014166 [Epithemia clementina (nom. ined.)]
MNRRSFSLLRNIIAGGGLVFWAAATTRVPVCQGSRIDPQIRSRFDVSESGEVRQYCSSSSSSSHRNSSNHDAADAVCMAPYSSSSSSSSSPISSTSYTAYDDVSWAIMSSNMSKSNSILDPHARRQRRRQDEVYQQFIQECIDLDENCRDEEDMRLHMNRHQPPAMINYTKTGFAKIRAPPHLIQLLTDFWNNNYGRQSVESDHATAFQNTWQVSTSLLKTEHDHLMGGGWNLSAAVWNAARDLLEEWTGQTLAGSSVYGIRLYHNQSILTPHVDRLPLVSSAIINVAQDVEEDWVLEVYGHDGKATHITMQPGDMVLYESHSVIHGRPFPLRGNYYANIFVHFEPMGDKYSTEPLPPQGSLPPYLVPDSPWAQQEYWKTFPNGWTLLTDVVELVRKGDLYTLQYVAQRDVTVLHARDNSPTQQCELLILATTQRHVDVVEFLVQEMDYDINLVCTARTALDHAIQEQEETDNAMIRFLVHHGGLLYRQLIVEQPERIQRTDARCVVLKQILVEWQDGSMAYHHEHDARITTAARDLMAFWFEVLGFDMNMVCGRPNQQQTPLDMRLTIYDPADRPRSGRYHSMEENDRDPIWTYLQHNRAKTKAQLDEEEEEDTEDRDGESIVEADEVDRCRVWEAVLQARMALPSTSALHVLRFLITALNYDVNMKCPVLWDTEEEEEDEDVDEESSSSSLWFVTPLDWAWDYFYHNVDEEEQSDAEYLANGDAAVRFLIERGGQTYDQQRLASGEVP